MKNLSLKILFLLGICLFTALDIYAAGNPPNKNHIDSQWYSLSIPEGWQVIELPAKEGIKSLSVLIINQKLKSGISVTTFENPLTAKQLAEITIANMKKDQVKIGDLTEKNKLLFTTFNKGKEKGEIYFGANGKDCAAISIYGNSLDAGKNVLKSLKPKSDGTIFPSF